MRLFLAAVVLTVLGLLGVGYSWVQSPLDLDTPVVDVSIAPGSSARQVANSLAEAGVHANPSLLYWWFRLSGQSRAIKAGSYELEAGTTPQSLLHKFVNGDQALRNVTLVEGWTFVQVREALRKAQHLKPDSAPLSAQELMGQLGLPNLHPEGRFFPDTYSYAKGSSDIAVLQRAMRAMDQQLEAAWSLRNPQVPLKTPEDALVLASIIEKETGRASDQGLISAVFNNRLLIGMRLQTDPTVIYGLGESFDGNLRRADLVADTPYNTYTREGLPPSPISMPGKTALLAAVQPAASKALYFVARGDGSSEFSESLDAHNRAVNKYQRGQ
ncbi:endolytic transglycosylase MltG [Rhodoferax sp.]|uniref:endolytic transglycosylase MltG n=1 Tax=Rhodoferax sp. TaxID=50421 RepID=UPI002ACDC969|nr:endolytic transglycosylase MltG [Rhodoferax sp.]MDZ7921127.1 endolytic transglycosylase MltG [Rhodoferax sp.]